MTYFGDFTITRTLVWYAEYPLPHEIYNSVTVAHKSYTPQSAVLSTLRNYAHTLHPATFISTYLHLSTPRSYFYKHYEQWYDRDEVDQNRNNCWKRNNSPTIFQTRAIKWKENNKDRSLMNYFDATSFSLSVSVMVTTYKKAKLSEKLQIFESFDCTGTKTAPLAAAQCHTIVGDEIMMMALALVLLEILATCTQHTF